MNLIAELDRQPDALLPLQLLLLFVFFTAYVTAMSGLFGATGRGRAATVALCAAIGVGFVFQPWTLGALIIAGSIGAVGVFIAVTLLFSRLLGVDGAQAPRVVPPRPRAVGRDEPPMPRPVPVRQH